ncbi:hypothetical protein B0T24DRAFT_501499, partial [Lasiosphaeria ovina]
MDPLSLTASIIAIIKTAEQIASVCKAYIDGVADCPKELRLIRIEAKSLSVVLEDIVCLREQDDDAARILDSISGPDGSLEACKRAVTDLHALLPDPQPVARSRVGTKRRRVELTLTALAWPLKRERARTLLGEIMSHKSTITMAMGGSVLRGVRSIKLALDQSQRKEVCEWFEYTDPSPNHNMAKRLYEKGTGNWVTRSREWIDWVEGRLRCLWLHGIPGAGKTVLAAHLIGRIGEFCEAETAKKCVSVYYYCYHGHSQDETSPFLRWLIAQLCREADSIPGEAYRLFQRGHQPDTDELLSGLHHSLKGFDTVFVTIDALDESQPRETLLKTLHTMIDDPRFRNLQLLATSREYFDIEQAMLGIPSSVSVPMSHPLVQADIKIYVSARIKDTTAFKQWPLSLKSEVEDSLYEGAQGMFRWAVCQLDILRRLKTAARIRNSIKSLPKTLDETYERILSLIHEGDRELVRFALHWLCFNDFLSRSRPDKVFMSCLIMTRFYSCSKRLEMGGDEEDLVFCDFDRLRDSCGCLVSFYSNEKQATLAHYTVREFLESNRIVPAHVEFRIEPDETFRALCRMVLTAALEFYQQDLDWILPIVDTVVAEAEDLVAPELAFRFLDGSQPHFEDAKHLMQARVSALARAFQRLNWGRENDVPNPAVVLTNLLEASAFKLAEKVMQLSSPAEMIETRFRLKTEYCRFAKASTTVAWKFKGTIIEFMASHPDDRPPQLRFLLDHFADRIDASTTLA